MTALQAIEDLSMMIGEEKCNLVMADDIIKCTCDMLMDQMTEISHELRRKLIKRYEDLEKHTCHSFASFPRRPQVL